MPAERRSARTRTASISARVPPQVGESRDERHLQDAHDGVALHGNDETIVRIVVDARPGIVVGLGQRIGQLFAGLAQRIGDEHGDDDRNVLARRVAEAKLAHGSPQPSKRGNSSAIVSHGSCSATKIWRSGRTRSASCKVVTDRSISSGRDSWK